jgi:hypothetical protein
VTIPVFAPGDVWAVDAPGFGRIPIILGSWLTGHPAPTDHVVTVHHQDKNGVWWGIEGRPSGVGWVDMSSYFATRAQLRAARGNVRQPRTDAQRAAVCKLMEGLLGTSYDWVGGIVADFDTALHAGELAKLIDHWWGWDNGAAQPAHVVCSSAAAWAYRNLGLVSPPVGNAELVTPADWWRFNGQWQ